MDDVLELTLLYDFYGELLTIKQREMFELYYMNDYSLSEVAERLSITPQAVSVLLARMRKRLAELEAKVGYMAFYGGCRQCMEEMTVMLEGAESVDKQRLLAHIKACGENLFGGGQAQATLRE